MRGLLIALGLLLAVTWVGGGYALYYVIRDDDAWSETHVSNVYPTRRDFVHRRRA